MKKEEFEDTKGAIRIHISKKKTQHNGQKKKYKRTNNDQQNKKNNSSCLPLLVWGLCDVCDKQSICARNIAFSWSSGLINTLPCKIENRI